MPLPPASVNTVTAGWPNSSVQPLPIGTLACVSANAKPTSCPAPTTSSTPNAGAPMRARSRAISTGAGVPQPAPYSLTTDVPVLHSEITLPFDATSRLCAVSNAQRPVGVGASEVAIEVQVWPLKLHNSNENCVGAPKI